MPSRGEYWRVGGINDKHIVEADLDQALQDKINTGGAGTPDFLFAELSVDQVSNLSATDHIEFDTVTESNSLTLSTGAGQLSGIIGNLQANKVYSFEAGLTIGGSNPTAELSYQFRDNTSASFIGKEANSIMVSSNINSSFQPICSAVHLIGGSTAQAELRITLNVNTVLVNSNFVYLRVIELTR